MKRVLIVIVIALLLATPVFAEWTQGKEDLLNKLVMERVMVERDMSKMSEWGYVDKNDIAIVRIIKLLTDTQKQTVLNALIVDKKTHNETVKNKHDEISTRIGSENIELDNYTE